MGDTSPAAGTAPRAGRQGEGFATFLGLSLALSGTIAAACMVLVRRQLSGTDETPAAVSLARRLANPFCLLIATVGLWAPPCGLLHVAGAGIERRALSGGRGAAAATAAELSAWPRSRPARMAWRWRRRLGIPSPGSQPRSRLPSRPMKERSPMARPRPRHVSRPNGWKTGSRG